MRVLIARVPALVLVSACASPSVSPAPVAPAGAPSILEASLVASGTQLKIALPDSAWVTAFEISPGAAVQLLAQPHDTAALAVALGPGPVKLFLRPVPDVALEAPESLPSLASTNVGEPVCVPYYSHPRWNEQNKSELLQHPYLQCSEVPAAPRVSSAVPARYLLLVATTRQPDAAVLRQRILELDLSGTVDALGDRLGLLVAGSAEGTGENRSRTALYRL